MGKLALPEHASPQFKPASHTPRTWPVKRSLGSSVKFKVDENLPGRQVRSSGDRPLTDYALSRSSEHNAG
jgi:hypothetical protein